MGNNAFPESGAGSDNQGLTKREFLVGMIMAGRVARVWVNENEVVTEVENCYKIADEILNQSQSTEDEQ